MSIEVLNFPRGIQIFDVTEWLQLVDRVVDRRSDEFKLLSPGVYDLTPDVGTEYDGKEELTVLDNGHGIHRTMVSDKVKAELYDPALLGREPKPMPSGSIVQLPEDRTRLTIIGQRYNSPHIMRLFSVIRWKP